MRKLGALTVALAAIAAIVAVRLLLDLPVAVGASEIAGLFLFSILNLVAESKPLLLPNFRGSHAEITLSGLSSYALVSLFPPFAAVVAGTSAVLVSEAFIKRKPFLKASFNTCQTFLSLAAASLVHALIVRYPLTPPLAQVLATAGAAMVYFLTNTGLVSLGVACLNRTPFWRIWSENYRWEVLYVLGSVPLALLLVFAYARLWIAGPVLFLGPLFLLRESYAQYIRLKTNCTETVRTLIKVIETHDTYTAGHSLRVAEYSKRLAVALKLPVREVERIEIAAYLHDLGKVDLGIVNLVKKPGRLTDEERIWIELHPVVSADLASQVTLFRGDIEEIIRHHHENHDGSGYPYGLRGEEIPLGARILHVADVFDAMVSHRAYRPALSLDTARSELRSHAGAHFDPHVVSVFLESCVNDPAMILEQHEPEDETRLADKLQQVLAARARRRPAAARAALRVRARSLDAAVGCAWDTETAALENEAAAARS